MERKKLGTSLFVASILVLAMYSTLAASAATVLYSTTFSALPNGSQPPSWAHGVTWSVQNGTYASTGSTGYVVAYYTGSTFSDFTYSVTAVGLPHCGQMPPVLGMAFRMKDSIDGYWFWGDIDKLQIVKWVNGQPNYLIVSPPFNSKNIGQINPTGNFTMTITAVGNTLTANWNNQFTITVQDSTYSSGFIGVGTYHCNAAFNNVLVTTPSTSTTSSSSTITTSPTTSGTTSTTSVSTTSQTSTSATSSTTTTTTSTTATTITTTKTCQVVFVEVNGVIVSAQIGTCT